MDNFTYAPLAGNSDVSEYAGLQALGAQSLFNIGRGRYRGDVALTPFVLFTDPERNLRGAALMDYIIKKDLGSVVRSETRTNPNSNNPLNIYIFAPDDKKFKAWYEPINEHWTRAYDEWRAAYERWSVRGGRYDTRPKFSFDFENPKAYRQMWSLNLSERSPLEIGLACFNIWLLLMIIKSLFTLIYG